MAENTPFRKDPKGEQELRHTLDRIDRRLHRQQDFTLPHAEPSGAAEVEENLEALVAALRDAGVLSQ